MDESCTIWLDVSLNIHMNDASTRVLVISDPAPLPHAFDI